MIALTRSPASAYADCAATLLVAGFGDPKTTRRTSATKTIAGAFFVLAMRRYGGCAWETFGSAGFRVSRFANLRTVTTHLFGDRRGDSDNTHGVSTMSNHTRGASAPSLLSRSLAAAHRRMALAALRADSSVSVRLARYNRHMTKARALAGGAA